MDALATLFDYHEWATLALIDHCAGLPPDVQAATVAGTHGSIQATLVHLVAADQRYLTAMLGGPPADRAVYERNPIPIGELRLPFEQQAQRWRSLIARANELDITLPGRGNDPDVPHAENLLFLQALHHGNDHRTQICTILGALGLDVPDIDGWAYWGATHSSR
jgi:uncharacterized damage-inducible protein DinB